MELDQLLKDLKAQKASDLHLKVGASPIIRKNGRLSVLHKELPTLTHEIMRDLCEDLIDESSLEKLKQHGSVDIGYGVKNCGRFRCNVAYQRGSIRIVIRHIPYDIPTIEELHLPRKLLNIIDNAKRGLLLISGNTGSGKSTTIASLINHINHSKSKHIVTIEDPIEFLIKDHYCLITQRDMDVDFFDPVMALKSSLRQDPDIIMLSELRLKDTISTALTAAETGHLVLSTIHAQDTAESISRLLNVFSADEQKYFSSTLANVLTAVIGQRLIPRKDGQGLVPAVEILINNNRIQEEIQKAGSTQNIKDIIKQSSVAYGMQSYDQHLAELVQKDLISKDTALSFADSSNDLKMILSGISFNRDQNTGT